jgi:hypothetical protein
MTRPRRLLWAALACLALALPALYLLLRDWGWM